MNIALVGNPNTGKTSLFNIITGASQKVGNFPGVTVEKKEGTFKIDDIDIKVVDLPGIYYLDPDTAEQRLAKKYIIENKPDFILNIVDSTNLERNLYLTLQLRTLKIPMMVVLNIIDETEKRGIEINQDALSKLLSMPVVAVSAHKKTGFDELYKLIYIMHNKTVRISPPCASCAGCSK